MPTYKKSTILKLQDAARYILQSNNPITDLRARYQHIDRYIARESDRSQGSLEARRQNLLGNKAVLRNYEVPVIISQLDSALAYMVELFLSGYPIYGVVAGKENQDAAAAMHAMMGRDSVRFKWGRELAITMYDSLKYNNGLADVTWKTKRINNIGTISATPSGVTGKAVRGEYSGNHIHRIDPYNSFLDPSVIPSQVSEHGIFAGYTEPYNYIMMRKLLDSLPNDNKIIENIDIALKTAFQVGSAATGLSYFEPEIRCDLRVQNNAAATNWAQFFGNIDENTSGAYRGNQAGMYHVTKLYFRAIPKEFSIVLPEAGTPRVFMMYLVNGVLVYCEPMEEAHGYIPIFSMQAYDEGRGHETKSFVENLMDMQDIGTTLQSYRLKTARRAVSDRALYDSSRISKHLLDSAQPDAKIGVKLNSAHKDLQSAYFPIPFRDDAGATINQEMNLLMGMSSSATGVNQTMQGNFVKGNRTLHEYDDISGNAQARLRKMAVLSEFQFHSPVKEVLKSNYLQYAMAETLVDQKTGKQITVDPVKLRAIEMSFKMSDGVLPTEKLVSVAAMQGALQAIPLIPDLAREYNTADIAINVLMQSGFTDLNDYKRTPDQVKAYDQQQQALAQQQANAATSSK